MNSLLFIETYPKAALVFLTEALPFNEECPGCVPCVEDFSPCSCIIFEEGVINVECDQVPFADVQYSFTLTTTTNLIRLFLTIGELTPSVPANLLGNNKAKEISITCLNRNFQLLINVDSFRASETHSELVYMHGCDLSQVNLSFMRNFQVINELSITNSTITSLSSLPSLSSLTRLIIANCQGFQSWGNPSVPSVRELYLNNNLLSDRAVSSILGSVSSSSNSLQALYLQGNSLTAVPIQISTFSSLTILNLNGNVIPSIASGSLSFGADPVRSLRLEGIELGTIQAGAFSGNTYQAFETTASFKVVGTLRIGNFEGAVVLLTANLLTRFDSDVFKNMLVDMKNTTGFLQMYFSKKYMSAYSNIRK